MNRSRCIIAAGLFALSGTASAVPVTWVPGGLVPEPGTLALFGLGLAALAIKRRKSRD